MTKTKEIDIADDVTQDEPSPVVEVVQPVITKTLADVFAPVGRKTGNAAHNYLRIGITLKDGDADVVRDALAQCNIGNIAEYVRKLIFDDLQKRLTK